MAFSVAVDDDQLKGFSGHAAAAVENFTKQYANELIREANRLEAGSGVSSDAPEVTAAMVHDAKASLQRGIGKPKRKKIGLIVLKVTAAVLSATAGAMYNDTKLQVGWYLLLFIFIVALSIITVTISTILE